MARRGPRTEAEAQLDTEWMAAINSRAQKEDRERERGRGREKGGEWRRRPAGRPNEEQFRGGHFHSPSFVPKIIVNYFLNGSLGLSLKPRDQIG